ncbi:hypothetical protein [Exiguobacterium sp. s155]|nr:hypothetical protein [Exiguobacterium sp. s155]
MINKSTRPYLAVEALEEYKRPPDDDRLRCSPDGAPTPAGKQSDGDPAAT